jgi:hypothetical protein
MRRISLFLSVCLLALASAGCLDQNYTFIQGTWERGDVHYVEEWTFHRSTFSYYSSIDMINPKTETGSFEIVDSGENQLTLDLKRSRSTFGSDSRQIVIKIDHEGESLKIGGGVFTRSGP